MTVFSTSQDFTNCHTIHEREWTIDDLFNHPDFRLLYVPPANEQSNMTIITPSKQQPTSFPHQGQKFYALSHLWGTEPNKSLWDVSGFISDEDDSTIEPISMRLEKREPLLSLLRANPGYWWIDVLCCRSETPPVIMCGVYVSAIEYYASVFDIGHLEDAEYMREASRYADKILDSRWFTRVWTLQEAILPPEVVLLSEICDTYDATKTITLQSLQKLHVDIINTADYVKHIDPCPSPLWRPSNDGGCLITMMETAQSVRSSLRSDNALFRFLAIADLLDDLGLSHRTCHFPVDYVYGILGILGWDIPRLADPNLAWKHFISKLKYFTEMPREQFDKHYRDNIQISISDKAQSFSLSTSTNLGDAYCHLLKLSSNCECTACKSILSCPWRHWKYYMKVEETFLDAN